MREMVGATRSAARRDQGRVDLFTLSPQSGTKGTSDPLVPLALSLPKGTRFQPLLKCVEICYVEVFDVECIA